MQATDPGFSSRPRQAKEVTDIGDLIGDRYRIEQVMREDATTSTVSARHLALEERVFVQVLQPEHRYDKRRTVQYLKAIKALARIKTDHVVRVLDVGVALFLGPFMVTEELEGNTLAELLHSEGPLPLARAVDYVLQACKGLAMAHAAGVVHGQLDTHRLLLARRGAFETLKVMEFPTLGIAPAQRGYLAPEVIRQAAPIDARADVWSLGAVLFELVSGRPALTSPASAAELAHEDAPSSPALRRIIARCLQPDPEQRFSDVDELAAELLPLTTLNEVFRGSLTGSFSRQMMMAAAAQAHAEARVERRAPLRTPAWAARAERLRSRLAQRDWRAPWRAAEQTWKQLSPGEPTLPQALAAAGGALLIGLACAGLGHARLVPPPGPRAPALAVEAAAVPPAAVPAPDLLTEPAPAQGSAGESAVPEAVEGASAEASAVEAPKQPSAALKHRRHRNSGSARRHQ
jgi:serine/threonine-protein kinase